MTLEQKWIEYDFNPFILFSHEGKILSLNAEAQFLLDSVDPKELFELATTHATQIYGFRTAFLDITFGRHKFFGITVGYVDDEQIGIKLYRFPTLNKNALKRPEGEPTNIYTVIDLCISSNSIGRDIEFIKDFDPTIPEIIIDSNQLVKVLNLIYKAFINNKSIKTRVYYRIGEHIKYEEKKYSLFSIEVSAKELNEKVTAELDSLAASSCFYLNIKNDSITINIPIVTE